MKNPADKQFAGPGFGKGKAKKDLKGRQVDPQALKEVLSLLGDLPRDRDLLIEHLHLIQDEFGYISAKHVAALASEMALSQTEVYEVATFYAHFDVVKEGETPPPALTIRVCDSLSCEMAGAKALIEELEKDAGPNVRIQRAPCMGRCHSAPVAEVGHKHLVNADAKTALDMAERDDTHPVVPDYITFETYKADGGYAVLDKCLKDGLTREGLVETMSDSGLRGLGGAGFPTGLKWKFVRQEQGPRLMAVNGDEGEPGTFKDHYYLNTDPHRFLEGMLVGAWVVEATDVYIYLRDEYPDTRKILLAEIEKLERAGLNPHVKIHLRRGAGAYICGEESAMIESIEGKRGLPRHRPPFVAQDGIFGQPTLVNNVETLYWVRDIVEKGAEWFASHGRHDRKGLRSFSISGRVKEPGVKLAPAGITMKELIEEYCGGMEDGHEFYAYQPGGPSSGILPASMGDIPLDFGTLQEYGTFIGSAAVVVLSDKDDIVDAVLNLMRFFEDESCGQCTPCRVGTEKAVKMLEGDKWNKELLETLSKVMVDASICGLGQAAPNPIMTMLKYFESDIKARIQ